MSTSPRSVLPLLTSKNAKLRMRTLIGSLMANLANHMMTQVGPTVDNIVVPCLRYLSFKNTIL